MIKIQQGSVYIGTTVARLSNQVVVVWDPLTSMLYQQLCLVDIKEVIVDAPNHYVFEWEARLCHKKPDWRREND